MPSRSPHRFLWIIGFGLILAGCGRDQSLRSPSAPATLSNESDDLASTVRALAAGRGITPMPAPPHVRGSLVRLGQALAFDKILSGNHDIACMTCHLPTYGTDDARSLSIGQGGVGLGPNRIPPGGSFIPRNAPSLFNLTTMKSLFWDGRVSVDDAGRFHTPAGDALTPEMTRVLEFGPASALALFPVQSREEMRGASGNELAAIPDDDIQGIWQGLMARLGAIPEYRRMFEAAYPGTRFEDMTFAHASNAIGAFLVSSYSFTDTPWDRFLHGDDLAMSRDQLEGAKTFLSLKCAQCHNGPALTDNLFHDVAVPQIGPGKGNGPGGHDDFGRMNVTGLPEDRYRFRTSPLRNVEITGPYGHDGAFPELRAFIDHYSQSDLKLENFDPTTLEPMLRSTLLTNFTDILANRDPIIAGVVLPAETVDQLTVFMSALTDPAVRHLDNTFPERVPSGLPIDQP